MATLHEDQAKIVEKALNFETAISKASKKLSQMEAERFKEAPAEPVKKVIEPDYPPLLNMPFSVYLEGEVYNLPKDKNHFFKENGFENCLTWLYRNSPILRAMGCYFLIGITGVILSMILGKIWSFLGQVMMAVMWVFLLLDVACCIYYYISRKKAYKRLLEEYPHTQEYLNARAAAEQKALREQAEADARYEEEKEKYHTVLLPEYKSELASWEAEHSQNIEKLSKLLNSAKEELDNLYSTTRLIPLQYRTIRALTYLHELMSTSDYDIKEAIEMYNKNESRLLEEQRLVAQKEANALAELQTQQNEEQNQLLAEQNYRLGEQNDIARKQLVVDAARGVADAYHQHWTRNKH